MDAKIASLAAAIMKQFKMHTLHALTEKIVERLSDTVDSLYSNAKHLLHFDKIYSCNCKYCISRNQPAKTSIVQSSGPCIDGSGRRSYRIRTI